MSIKTTSSITVKIMNSLFLVWTRNWSSTRTKLKRRWATKRNNETDFTLT